MPLTSGACVSFSVSNTISTCPTQKWGVAQVVHLCPRPPVPDFLRWFGPIARSRPEIDHLRALHAAINNPPRDWKRRRGRPAHTWIRTVEADLKSCNTGLHSAWYGAQDQNAWGRPVQTAMPQSGVRSWWWCIRRLVAIHASLWIALLRIVCVPSSL